MKNKLLYSTNDIAKILGISHTAVFKKIVQGKLKAEKIGRNYVIPASEVEKLGHIKNDPQQEISFSKIPEINNYARALQFTIRKKINLEKGKTLHISHEDLFTSQIKIKEQDILVGFNEPAFKKSDSTEEVFDLDSPLNARLITYFLPAVQIAHMQEKRPRLIIITGINAAIKYNAHSDQERKIMYRNAMLKIQFIKETLETFFPETFSVIEIRHAYDFLKIPESKLDALWILFIKRYPEKMKPLETELARFIGRGTESIDQEKLKIAFRYSILHIFALGDINLDYDFIHGTTGYCSIGEHQESVFNTIRELGYNILKDFGNVIFDRDIIPYNNSKIIIESVGHIPPPYNGVFKKSKTKIRLDEVTYENGFELSYYETRPRLKPHMDYLYKIIPKEKFEAYWNFYKTKYFSLKERLNEAYNIVT
jgi:excisionase family DNA binding protein